MTDDSGAKPPPPAAPEPSVQVQMPLPPAPASPNDGLGAQDARVLGLALGGGLVALLGVSPIPAAAIIPAFGVIAVWLYGRWLRRKQNKALMQLHDLLRGVTGGWIQ